MKKKLISLVLASLMAISLCACNYEVKVGDKVVSSSDEEAKSEEELNEGAETLDALVEEGDKAESEEVTAESLLSQSYEDVTSVSQKINMVMDFEMPLDADTRAELEAMGNVAGDLAADVKVDMNMQMDTTLHAEHVYGSIYMEMMGMKMDIPMESYVDYDAGIEYEGEYNASTGATVWTSSPSTDKAEFGSSTMVGTIEDTTLTELDGKYIVKGFMSSSEFDDMGIGDIAGTETVTAQVPVTCTFDKETKRLSGLSVDLTPIIPADSGATIAKCELTSTIFNYNAVDVVIPGTVITSATDSANASAPAVVEVSDNVCIAQSVFGTTTITCDDVYAQWINPEVGYVGAPADYKWSTGVDDDFDDVILSLTSLLCNYTEEELLDALDYVKYSSWDDVAAMLLLGDLDELGGAYRTKLGEVFKSETSADMTRGTNYYLELCGLN